MSDLSTPSPLRATLMRVEEAPKSWVSVMNNPDAKVYLKNQINIEKS